MFAILYFLLAYRNSWTLNSRVGRWTLDAGLWTLDSGRWTLDAGLWTLDSESWTLNSGSWTMDTELWTLDAGLSALYPGLLTLDVGLWALDTIFDCFRTESAASCSIETIGPGLAIFRNSVLTLSVTL